MTLTPHIGHPKVFNQLTNEFLNVNNLQIETRNFSFIYNAKKCLLPLQQSKLGVSRGLYYKKNIKDS